MAKIAVWKCPKTGKLFEHAVDYKRHKADFWGKRMIRRMRRQRMRDASLFLKASLPMIRDFQELARWIEKHHFQIALHKVRVFDEQSYLLENFKKFSTVRDVKVISTCWVASEKKKDEIVVVIEYNKIDDEGVYDRTNCLFYGWPFFGQYNYRYGAPKGRKSLQLHLRPQDFPMLAIGYEWIVHPDSPELHYTAEGKVKAPITLPDLDWRRLHLPRPAWLAREGA